MDFHHTFVPGSVVRITGLVKQRHLNGMRGLVQPKLKWRHERITVLLNSPHGKCISLRDRRFC